MFHPTREDLFDVTISPHSRRRTERPVLRIFMVHRERLAWKKYHLHQFVVCIAAGHWYPTNEKKGHAIYPCNSSPTQPTAPLLVYSYHVCNDDLDRVKKNSRCLPNAANRSTQAQALPACLPSPTPSSNQSGWVARTLKRCLSCISTCSTPPQRKDTMICTTARIVFYTVCGARDLRLACRISLVVCTSIAIHHSRTGCKEPDDTSIQLYKPTPHLWPP